MNRRQLAPSRLTEGRSGSSRLVRAARLPDLLAEATARLAGAGVASPRHDAEELAAHALGVRRKMLAGLGRSAAGAEIDTRATARLAALVDRRARREPLQHLTGRAGFRYLEVAVGPGVFVPRPETEVVVAWCLRALAETASPAGAPTAEPALVVVDLCAGSGVVALSLAQEHPAGQVHAVEDAEQAYRWLMRNAAERAAVGDRPVMTHHADAARALPELDGTAALVVSNPPYVADGRPVEIEVADHDPPAALRAGPDGLVGVRLVERAARRLLRPGGQLAVEHGDDQGEEVPALLAAAGWVDVADHNDLAGRPRFATARKLGSGAGTGVRVGWGLRDGERADRLH